MEAGERIAEAAASEADLETAQVVIGAVDRSFGVKGEMLIRSLTDVPGRFQVGAPVRVVGPRGHSLVTVMTTVRAHGTRLIVGLEDVRTPEAVAEFRGGYLYADKSEAAPPPAHYFQCDLLGLTVKDEHGRSLGVLDHLLETPAHHLFVIRDGTQEVWIPAVKEWVREVDLVQRVMTVRVPELSEAPGAQSDEVSRAV